MTSNPIRLRYYFIYGYRSNWRHSSTSLLLSNFAEIKWRAGVSKRKKIKLNSSNETAVSFRMTAVPSGLEHQNVILYIVNRHIQLLFEQITPK